MQNLDTSLHQIIFLCAIVGCELWTENSNALLALVKEYIMDLWEVWKVKLYGLSPWLEIQGMALWLGVREMVSLVSSVTQGE